MGAETPGPALEEVERAHVLAVLERVGWRVTTAATLLKVSFKTVYNRLHDWERRGLIYHDGKAYRLTNTGGEGDERAAG